MTISRKEKTVPKELPPARLYLDDLEMLIRVFQQVRQNENDNPEDQPELKFELEKQECTELADLPKIAETTKNLTMEMNRSGFSLYLRIAPEGTYWDAFGLTREEEWSLYSKLEPIFRDRERRAVALAHRIPRERFSGFVLVVIGLLLFFPVLVSYSQPFIVSPRPSTRIPVACALVLLTYFYVHEWLASGHSLVVLSPYSASAAKRRETVRNKAWDIAKIILAAVVGALIYKFWTKP